MIETGNELALRCRELAENYSSIYALGAFGWPMNESNKQRTIAAYAYNRKDERQETLMAAKEDWFAFDCVGMIKALLWGWEGKQDKTYGGAVYVSNGVPDKSANQVIALCSDVSDDFSRIQPGEVVWLKGHIGVYIGDGLAVECTPRWADGVQITAVHNLGKQDGVNGRYWTSHGKLPWISYRQTYSLELTMLRKGCQGAPVKALQQLLIGNGFCCGSWGADGDFGAATEESLIGYQKSAGLAADGVAGPESMAALLGAMV